MNETTATAAPKKVKKGWIKWLIIGVVLAALGVGGWLLFGGKSAKKSDVMTDFVSVGSITSNVTGSGLTKARNSETLTLTTTGSVVDVFVAEGDHVEVGDKLFVLNSPAAETAYTKAKNNLDGYRKQLSSAMKDIAGLHLSAPHNGKLMNVTTFHVGDSIYKGDKVATLIDDSQMRLTQYYSYAYANQIKSGQKMDVSIPALMSSVQGTVEDVRMVSRITPEGSKLFAVTILVPNEGALTADMVAAATATVGSETIYPYESGALEYNRVSELTSTVSGKIVSSKLYDYLQVRAGEVLLDIDGEDSENEIFTIQQNIESAERDLENAQKNLDNCNAVAPIAGTVIGLNVRQGSELAANTTLLTISDTSSVLVNATVDERNVSYLKPGMTVDLDQWGTTAMGVIDSVSLSSTVSGGVATYPVVISVDNEEGKIQINSYINYSLVASQSENCLILPIQCVRTAALESGEIVPIVYVRKGSSETPAEITARDEEVPDDFYPVQVEIGIQDAYNVEIKSGVEEGTEVFTQMITAQAWG